MYIILSLDRTGAPTKVEGMGGDMHNLREWIRTLTDQGKKVIIAKTIDVNTFMTGTDSGEWAG